MLRSTSDFLGDQQGRKFFDVVKDNRIAFQQVIDFFVEPDRVRRLIESELDHDRPPLAGVIREFEAVPAVSKFLSSYDAHTTRRFRQAVGVVVRIIMETCGWSKTGRKGSLGKRADVPPHTTTPGAYHNVKGLSIWFTRTERYTPPTGVSMKKLRSCDENDPTR
jgi:hypothetical protein